MSIAGNRAPQGEVSNELFEKYLTEVIPHSQLRVNIHEQIVGNIMKGRFYGLCSRLVAGWNNYECGNIYSTFSFEKSQSHPFDRPLSLIEIREFYNISMEIFVLDVCTSDDHSLVFLQKLIYFQSTVRYLDFLLAAQ